MTRSRFGIAALLLGCVAVIGCSSDDESGQSRCAGGRAECGQACDTQTPCPAGLFCGDDGSCRQECLPGDEDTCQFGPCRPDGRCPSEQSAANTPSGGFGNSTVQGSAGTTSMRDAAVDDVVSGDTCLTTTVSASRVTPTVLLIVDQSSSMTENFSGGASRWDALRDFLLDEPDGLIASLQDRVRFGLALFSAESGGQNPDPIGECPMVTSVAPSLDNFDAIANVYRNADVIEDTPTGDSIDAVIDSLDLNLDPDAEREPLVFILATDGEPDRCEELDPQNGQQEAIDAVTRAFSLGIRTFIISVGEGTVSADHQQAVANAGLGLGAGDDPAEYWVAGDDTSLRSAISDIVGAQLSCDINLDGEVKSGDPCKGVVTLNGDPLGCNDGNGWQLMDPGTIRLNGSACERLKNDDVMLEVRFPCDVEFVE